LSRLSEDPAYVNYWLLIFDYCNITEGTGFKRGKRWPIDPFFLTKHQIFCGT